MLLPTDDPEFTDDELAEPVSTPALVGMLLWIALALVITAPGAALAALFSRPVPADLAFADPIKAALRAARLDIGSPPA